MPLSVESKVNHQLALDFMDDTLYCGKRFRVINIINESTRECPAIEFDTSLPAQRLVRVMEQLKAELGLPNQVRVDNDPALVSNTFADWYEEQGIEIIYIQKGKPLQKRTCGALHRLGPLRVLRRLSVRIAEPGARNGLAVATRLQRRTTE